MKYCFSPPLCEAIPTGLLPDILTCRMSLMKLKGEIFTENTDIYNKHSQICIGQRHQSKWEIYWILFKIILVLKNKKQLDNSKLGSTQL